MAALDLRIYYYFFSFSFLLFLFVYAETRRYGGKRGLYSVFGHLVIVFLGLHIGPYWGFLFVSLPLLFAYYYLLYRFSEILIPASNPHDRQEKLNRFKILVWYTWGFQFPIIVVDDPASMKFDVRIKGSSFQTLFGIPGYVWARMPQAVGITSGTNFSRVEGPGAIYTGPYERPLDVIDLRTQLRTTEVNAITQDGVPIKAIVLTSFAIDREPWGRSLYNRLKFENPMLTGGMESDHGNSHFQYSRARVRAALSMEGVQTSIMGPIGSLSLRWDEQVLNMVAEAARRVISETPLSELWIASPEKDGKGVCSLDIIADKIKAEKTPGGLFDTLQKNGVRLYAARVVNYFSPNDKPDDKVDELTRQQLPSWRVRWEQRIIQKIAEADAEVEQKQLDATALARSMLLGSVAESLKNISRETSNKDLPRYLIAMRFLGAIEEMIHQTPELEAGEQHKGLRERFAYIRNNINLPRV